MLLRIIVLTSIFIFLNVKAEDLKNCKWDNRNGIPCIAISKTPNTSYLSQGSVNKIVINRQEIEKSVEDRSIKKDPPVFSDTDNVILKIAGALILAGFLFGLFSSL